MSWASNCTRTGDGLVIKMSYVPENAPCTAYIRDISRGELYIAYVIYILDTHILTIISSIGVRDISRIVRALLFNYDLP